MKLKCLLIILGIFNYSIIYAQDTLSIENIYLENSIVYDAKSELAFTGVAQKMRKNGHLVFEEVYDQGILVEFRGYYNGNTKRLSDKIFYYRDKPFVPKEAIRYYTNKKQAIIETTSYNRNEEKTLVTRYADTTLIYKCSYKNGKKNGKEFCYDKNDKPLITTFKEGKKVKD